MCPECGAPAGLSRRTSYDADDRPLRQRICQNCGAVYPTIEVPAPPGVSFYELAEGMRMKHTLKQRATRGFRDTGHGRYLRKRRRVIVTVRLTTDAA